MKLIRNILPFVLFALFAVNGELVSAQEGTYTRDDCGVLTGVTDKSECLQLTNVNGRLAGRTYIWNGSIWVEKAAPSIVNAQTGITYTVQNSDSRKLVTFSNASAIAVTLPQAGVSSAFLSGWFADFNNRGAGTITITPMTSTIDGAASIALSTNQGARIYSDGTNYYTVRGGVAGGGGGDDQNASEVPFNPAGNISSSNVQSAIEELDSEKASLAGSNDFQGAILRVRGTLESDAVSPAEITGNQDNYAGCATKTICRVTLDVDHTITSFTGGGNWRVFEIWNIDDTDSLTLENEAATGTAANRIITNTGDDLVVPPLGKASCQYDNTSSRHRCTLLGAGGVTVESDTSDSVFDRGDGRITGATEAKPFEICGDDTDNCIILQVTSADVSEFLAKCGGVLNDCDYYRQLANGKKGGFKDSDGNVEFEHTEDVGITAMTVDAETSGVTITIPEKKWLPFAACQNTTASLIWDSPTTNAAAAACVTGTNTQKGVADFDATTDESLQMTYLLPSDFTGAIDARIRWHAAATTGSVGWCVQLVSVADGETGDPAFPAQGAGNCTSDAVKGTTLQENDATITGVTATGVAAGELLYIRVSRDGDGSGVTDDMTGDARGIGLELTFRRAL